MEITSKAIKVYSPRKNQSRYENFKTASSSKNTAYALDGHFSAKLLKDSEGSADQKMLANCSRGKVRGYSCKGKGIRQAKIEDLNERLKILEEENETMKQIFIETMEERKKLVNEIYKGNQVTGLKL